MGLSAALLASDAGTRLLSSWGEADLHRLVATFLAIRFPILLALNKVCVESVMQASLMHFFTFFCILFLHLYCTADLKHSLPLACARARARALPAGRPPSLSCTHCPCAGLSAP